MHPVFPLLDANGIQVALSQQPVSAMKTCGTCHDTEFIASHSTHPDFSGEWDALTYRYNTLTGEQPGTSTAEMNCFLCHTAQPNTAAWRTEVDAGALDWAATATLLGTGIVEQVNEGWVWNASAFDAQGNLQPTLLTVQDPTSNTCGQCHGTVHVDSQIPLVADLLDPNAATTYTTGQIISPQRIASSGLNLIDKADLSRSWDVHAERVINCTDCHYAANNPIYYRESDESQPEHLTFDPRRLDLGEYLYRPVHQFSDTARTCESCHSLTTTHDWLPYKDRHTSAVACESCHVPTLYAPALQSVDWTVVRSDGKPIQSYRGVAEVGASPADTLISGFEPVLLPRANADGSTRLAPYNLATAWYWVAGEQGVPIPLEVLQSAWMDGSAYHSDVLNLFDTNGNGALEDAELVLDTSEKTALIAGRLEAAGLENPRIVGEVEEYPVYHNIAYGEWATRDCQTCHSEDSRLASAVVLSDRLPGGITPMFEGTAANGGTFSNSELNILYFQPEPIASNLYILGHDSVHLVDWLGMAIFLGTAIVASIHGGLRYFAARRGIPKEPEVRRVYMYTVYERQWHWLQTVVIFGLIFTGFVIHKPETFGIFSFGWIVQVHNILAIILVVNAALAAFYHLASGEIRQFLPEPHGFFHQAILQAKYYLRGIFHGEPHPSEKTPQHKLNPLQQITYLGLLNVLLPLQIITGILMWGAQQWPTLAASLGGLPFLAPLHTLLAWLFPAFIMAHVYLTTTGHTPMSDIKAMITGWDEVEVQTTNSITGEPQHGSTD